MKGDASDLKSHKVTRALTLLQSLKCLPFLLVTFYSTNNQLLRNSITLMSLIFVRGANSPTDVFF